MTPEDFATGLEAAFGVHWSRMPSEITKTFPDDAAPVPSLVFQGKSFNPSKLKPGEGFAWVSVQHLGGIQAALGTSLYRRTGRMAVQCYGRSGLGRKLPERLAGYAESFFKLPAGLENAVRSFASLEVRENALMALGIVRWANPGTVTVGDDGTGWFQAHAVSEFSYDEFR